MALQIQQVFIDTETDSETQLVLCPCGNNVFYFTNNDKKICAGCYGTNEEAQAAKDLMEEQEILN